MKKIIKIIIMMICGAKIFAQDMPEFFIRDNKSDITVIDHKNIELLSLSEFEKKVKNTAGALTFTN